MKLTITHSYNLRKRSRNNDSLLETDQFPNNSKISNNKVNVDESLWDSLRTMNNIENDDDNKVCVSATHTKNYLLNDPVLDYYKYLTIDDRNKYQNKNQNKNQKQKRINKSNNFLCNIGNNFEDEVCDYLTKKYKNQTKTILSSCEMIDENKIVDTCNAMKKGIPMIFQGVLYSKDKSLRGVADIIIRSDWINKLFKIKQINTEQEKIKAPLLNGNYHYRVIDIKWSTIPLCKDSIKIRNTDRFQSYKGQLAIYNAIIGEIQGFTPPTAYILGKSYKINKTINNKVCDKKVYNCFERLGHILYDDLKSDYKYLDKTKSAIEWYRDLQKNGDSFELVPPSRPELFPNMCNKYNDKFNDQKQKHAEEINEITQLWNVGVNEREIAHSKGIYQWTDKECNAKNLGICEKSKKGQIINSILNINRDSRCLLSPKKIIDPRIKKRKLEFYIDIEAIDNMLIADDINIHRAKVSEKVIFLIGIGYEENDQWRFKKFLIDKYDRKEHLKIVQNMINFIEEKRKSNKCKDKPYIYHWGNFEKSVFKEVNNKNFKRFNLLFKNYEFVDLNTVFKNSQIVIKGCMKYGLKDVANAMYQNNMINIKWDTNCVNGLQAMQNAIEAYVFFDRYEKMTKREKKKQNLKYIKYNDIIDDIIEYNEIDCKVLWEILNYLRKEHL